MRASRTILLVLMMALLSFASKVHAATCLQICQNNYDACVTACDGNTSCKDNCAHMLVHCDINC